MSTEAKIGVVKSEQLLTNLLARTGRFEVLPKASLEVHSKRITKVYRDLASPFLFSTSTFFHFFPIPLSSFFHFFPSLFFSCQQNAILSRLLLLLRLPNLSSFFKSQWRPMIAWQQKKYPLLRYPHQLALQRQKILMQYHPS